MDDGWFLGALLIVATRPELFENILVSDPKQSFEYGFFVFWFFKNGKWEYVFIDTWIPMNPETKSPLYGKCTTTGSTSSGSPGATEYWVPFIEKAYAKLHGSYEALNGGSL